jgi:DNA-binding transcriptional LysR family regulator
MEDKILIIRNKHAENFKSLIRIADMGNLSKSAPNDLSKQALYIRHLKELENYFGFKLARFDGNEICLTRKGVELAKALKKMLN